MNEPIGKTSPARRGGKPLAMLGAVVFVVVALFGSRLPLPPAAGTAAADEEKPAGPTSRAVKAANAFLDALDARQKEKTLYEFDSTKKSRWSNLPVTFVPRNGIPLGDMSKEQRAKAMAVVAAVLSKGGYQKVVDIMDGDQQLVRGGGRGGRAMFGKDLYYLAIFGKPSDTKAWMVQFGGHHLGVNVTVVGKHFVLTPTHTGAQPALFKRDGKDVRPLGQEADAAFKLVNALDKKQQAQAILAEKPQSRLLLGPGEDGKAIKPEGVKGSALTQKQQAMLLDVIAAWVKIVEPAAAAARMAEIKGKIGETFFAWKGPTAQGSAAYFRVQGPAVVIEYAPQGGTGHIHTVVRNPKDDYGTALLKR
jgi:hypothetical protein